MGHGVDLYGRKTRGNPGEIDFKTAVARLRQDFALENPQFTPQHWARLEQDLVAKIAHSTEKQSSHKLPNGSDNPNYAKNRGEFDRRRKMNAGGGSGAMYPLSAVAGAADGKSLKSPRERRHELRQYQLSQKNFMLLKRQAQVMGRLPR